MRLFGIGRQIEGRELRGGVRRDADAADPGRDKTIAAFETPRKRIGVELRAQLIGTGHGHGAVGGDVLPAISQRGRDIGRSTACRTNAPAWNRSECPVPLLATEKFVPPPASAKPAIVYGEMR